MINKDVFLEQIVSFITEKVDALSKESMLFNLLYKTNIKRGVNNKKASISKALDFLADEDGMVDAEGIIDDMFDNLIITKGEEKGIVFENGDIIFPVPGIGPLRICKEDIDSFRVSLKK